MKEIEEIWTSLQKELVSFEKEQNAIKRLELSRKASWEAIERLEVFLALRNGFEKDPSALIGFNRNHAPRFYARFIFLSKVCAFECLRNDSDVFECEELFKVEEANIRRFFKQHFEFRCYYLSGRTRLDALFFQNSVDNPIRLDDLVVDISPNVNKGCLLVAYMQALEEYRTYLEKRKQNEQSGSAVLTDLQWTGKPTDLGEVAIALQGFINRGPRTATFKEITQTLGALLHVNLGNVQQLDNKRRNRFQEAPSFLEKLAEIVRRRKNKLDDDQDSRTRRG